MDFYTVLDQVVALLRNRGRASYRALKRRFALDDEVLADLRAELRYARYPVAEDEDQGLVWTGETGASAVARPAPPGPETEHALHAERPPVEPHAPDAERRQLTVLFCDLVDSTVLASQLDPEDWREVVRAYQDTCARVIARYGGHIAQYLGDGLLVYFGYPQAHEDDAQRAVRAGLGMVEAVGQLNRRLTQEHGVSLAMRLGIHTGLVVVGDMGDATHQEQLALGETPNVAARLQGIASPNTPVISAATVPLLGGFFACQSLGTPSLKGVAQPIEVYQVLHERMARSRLEAAGSTSLTPLVGRGSEVALLRERWEQVKEGMGQVVLLSGEAGIGKSRLVQVLAAQVATEPQAWLTPCQYSPYYQHTALYPMIDLLERVVLATKVHGTMDDQDPNAWGTSRRHLLEQCEASLRRLQTEYIDLYQLHRPLSTIPIDETLRALDDLVRSGKVRYLGTSTFAAWQLVEALWVSKALGLHRVVCEPPRYHRLDRRIERELVPMGQTYGLAVLPWSPLAGGFLSGKYRCGEAPPPGSRLGQTPEGADPHFTDAAFQVLEVVTALAHEQGVTPGQVALPWVAQQPGITSPIIGPRTRAQLEDCLGAMHVRLTAEDRARLDAVVPPGRAIVPYYEADFGPHRFRW